jgi:3-hydroxyisobutyrate dehydrogenase-like beta-hydroxyacid dehydrogenase
MSAISVIGLGSMGTALAKAMLGGALKVTVWNRSAAKMLPLVKAGAQAAPNLAAAVQASPIILVCIDNYATTKQIMGEPGVIPLLSGKTLIQLSTGTPKEAREAEAWFKLRGAEYIDGAIMEYPNGIGTPTTKILFAGPEATFKHCATTLRPLGGNLKYVGPNIGAAAALDLALLSKQIALAFGVIHGALICKSELVELDVFGAELIGGDAKAIAQIIHTNDYSNPGATLGVWSQVLQRIQTQARDAKINSDIPDFIASIFKRAITLGFEQENKAAIFKALH